MSFRSPLGQARGLGSAKSGTGHFMAQRLTAMALIPLTLWFVWELLCHAGSSHEEFVAWIGQPLVAALMAMFCIALFHHAQLGLQVVIEDYVHGEGAKLLSLVLVKLAAALAAVTCVISILLIAVGQ
ncbi:MAG: succinate dehydrogenase, hydrophobic membrane anchor protein [Oceanococcaceae bacterium]